MQEKVKVVKFIPLNMTQQDPDNQENYFRLNWSTRLVYPRMSVFTENGNYDKNKPFNYDSMLVAPFNSITVRIFLEYFQDVIDGENDKKKVVECYNSTFENGVKVPGKISLQAKAVVGKDKDGVMYLAVIAEGKRKVKIDLLPDSRFYKFLDDDGEIITDRAKLSILHSKGYLKVLTRLLDVTLGEDGIESDGRPSQNTYNPSMGGDTLPF